MIRLVKKLIQKNFIYKKDVSTHTGVLISSTIYILNVCRPIRSSIDLLKLPGHIGTLRAISHKNSKNGCVGRWDKKQRCGTDDAVGESGKERHKGA